jgi:hypothetical protein
MRCMPTNKRTLTAGEISFLKWLRARGGIGARTGNIWLGETGW